MFLSVSNHPGCDTAFSTSTINACGSQRGRGQVPLRFRVAFRVAAHTHTHAHTRTQAHARARARTHTHTHGRAGIMRAGVSPRDWYRRWRAGAMSAASWRAGSWCGWLRHASGGVQGVHGVQGGICTMRRCGERQGQCRHGCGRPRDVVPGWTG